MQEEQGIDIHTAPKPQEYSRRDFARMAALGAAAATTVGFRASAADCDDPNACNSGTQNEIEFCQVTTEGCDAYVGPRCANFLKALNNTRDGANITVETLLYGSFDNLLTLLHAGESVQENKDLLQRMRKALKPFKEHGNGFDFALADILVHGRSDSPGGIFTGNEWRDIYTFASNSTTASGTSKLRELYPLTFLELEKRPDPGWERDRIYNILFVPGPDGRGFRERVGRYRFIDLYTKPAKDVFSTDPYDTSKPDAVGHRWIREAFRSEMFTIRDAHYLAQFKNNDKCWSVSAEGCISDQHEMYCNDVGGSPSSSSDICP